MALVGLVNRLFRTRYTDLCYGFNAFWSRCLPSLDVDCDGFEIETLINIRAIRRALPWPRCPASSATGFMGCLPSRPGPTGSGSSERCSASTYRLVRTRPWSGRELGHEAAAEVLREGVEVLGG